MKFYFHSDGYEPFRKSPTFVVKVGPCEEKPVAYLNRSAYCNDEEWTTLLQAICNENKKEEG